MEPNETINKIIDAHGGEDLWRGIKALEAEISASGLLFTFKRRRVRPILFAGKPLPGPILVALDIHAMSPVTESKT